MICTKQFSIINSTCNYFKNRGENKGLFITLTDEGIATEMAENHERARVHLCVCVRVPNSTGSAAE